MVGWLYQLSEKLDDPINSDRSNLPSAMTSYISALYFTCTSLTSVGFGNVSPNTNAEKIFSVAAMLIGGTVCKMLLTFSHHTKEVNKTFIFLLFLRVRYVPLLLLLICILICVCRILIKITYLLTYLQSAISHINVSEALEFAARAY